MRFVADDERLLVDERARERADCRGIESVVA